MRRFLVVLAVSGFREGGGNLPRGLWIVDGVFVVDFTPALVKTVRMIHGSTHNVCTDIG